MNRRGFLSFLVSAPITARLPWQSIANFIKPVAPSLGAGIEELTFSKIVSETIRRNRPKLAANMMAHNALLHRLRKSAVIKPFAGGIIMDKDD